jgi:hypothetical protein
MTATTALTSSLCHAAVLKSGSSSTVVKVAQRFATQFGQKLTKKKLGQFVPIAGVVIGAALNWKMVDDVASAAYWAYRERFLYEKDGELARGTRRSPGTTRARVQRCGTSCGPAPQHI